MRYGDAVHFTTGGQLASWIESEPSEPEDEYTQCRYGQVVSGDGPALAVLAVFAATRSECDGSDQGKDTAYAVHYSASCEIVETKIS